MAAIKYIREAHAGPYNKVNWRGVVLGRGLLFFVGLHRLISSSHVSFDLLLFASLYLLLNRLRRVRNYHLKILVKVESSFRHLYRAGGEAISTGFFQGSSK